MRRVFAAAAVLVLVLIATAVYVGHGPLNHAKLTTAAIVLPLACVASLWLMFAWRKAEESGR